MFRGKPKVTLLSNIMQTNVSIPATLETTDLGDVRWASFDHPWRIYPKTFNVTLNCQKYQMRNKVYEDAPLQHAIFFTSRQ